MDKRQIFGAIAVYCLGLFLGCFLSVERLTPWYESRTGEDDVTLKGLRSSRELSRSSGLSGAMDGMDCRLAILFNETYKDLSKCRNSAESDKPASELAAPDDSPYFRTAYLNADQAARRKMAYEVYSGLKRLAARPTGFHPGTATDSGLRIELAASAGQSASAQDPAKKAVKSVLAVGDSLALGLAPSLEKSLQRYEGVNFARVGKVSSGLASPHIYDWEKNVPVLIDEHHPDILLVIMGVNDANNNIRFGDIKAILGTPLWPEAYQKRVESFLAAIAKKKTPVYWIELPVVRDVEMSARISLANEAAKKACEASEGCRFVDTWKLLTDDKGEYTNFKKDDKGFNIRIRAKDGVHFSTEGGDLLSEYILDYISKYVELKPKKETEQHI